MESTESSDGQPLPPSPMQPNLPPGFRFHPTDEELVVHYLKRKADSVPLPVSIIADVDLYKFDPWELPEKAWFGEEEWYFFSPRDRKYPNGARPNRAAISGYWKATGTDKPVISKGGGKKLGVKKALVFYSGKPPKGVKSDWIMHEYRLTDTKPNHICDFANKKNPLRLDDWVLCRIYKKNNSTTSRHHHQHDMMIFSDNNDPAAVYDGGGGNYTTMNHNSAYGLKQNQLFPPLMTSNLNQDSGIGSSSSPSKRSNGGGVGDFSNIVSSMASPLIQNQGGIYQCPGLNWYS